jgi:hypothetical protein
VAAKALVPKTRERRPPPDRYDNLQRELSTAGCVACRLADWSEERFVVAFLHESHTDASLLDHLGDSLGFCARHTRRLLSLSEASWVMLGVYADVVREAHRRWDRRGGITRAHRPAVFPAECPMCESGRGIVDSTLRVLAADLGDAAGPAHISALYESNGGLCVSHARGMLPWCGQRAARTILRVLAGAVDRHNPLGPPTELLIGRDPDSPRRAPLRHAMRHLADAFGAREADQDVLESVADRLVIRACPCCVAQGIGEARALAWLATESARDLPALAADGVTVCARHLHDMLVDDAAAAARLASLERVRLRWDVASAEARFDGLMAPTGPARLLRAVDWVAGGGRQTVARALAAFTRPPECFVCRAMRIAGTRERALLTAALRDAPTRARYEAAHGLCVRHALGFGPSNTASNTASQCTSRTLGARLAVLSWELDTAANRRSWGERFDMWRSAPGAWLRAGTALDGQIFLGGPAMRLG